MRMAAICFAVEVVSICLPRYSHQNLSYKKEKSVKIKYLTAIGEDNKISDLVTE
jgi:hypothetical protein